MTDSERDLRTLSGIVSDNRAVVTHEGSAALSGRRVTYSPARSQSGIRACKQARSEVSYQENLMALNGRSGTGRSDGAWMPQDGMLLMS